jgi:hypothetical protein
MVEPKAMSLPISLIPTIPAGELWPDVSSCFKPDTKPRKFKLFPLFKDWNIPETPEALKMNDTAEKASDWIFESMKAHALTAIQKNDPAELTNEEKAAICYFAGVPSSYDMVTGKRTYHAGGFYKQGEKWVVVIPPKAF